MNKSLRLVVAISFLAAVPAGATVIATDRVRNELPIDRDGLVVIDNTIGAIEVAGGNEAKVVVTADRVVRAVSDTAVAEARLHVNRTLAGDQKTRIIRTIHASSAQWNVQVNYTLIIPRTANLKILSRASNRIRVSDVTGQVSVNNVHGPVLIDNVRGPVSVQSINGDVTFISQTAPRANARLSSVNGSIVVRAPASASFVWEVETVAGQARTGYPVRQGQYLSTTRFRTNVNNAASVTLVTETFGGNVAVIPLGVQDTETRLVRDLVRPPASEATGVGPMLPTMARSDVQMPLFQGYYRHETSLGDVRIGEIRGAAHIVTGAGEVSLGTVFGHTEVVSFGGPLNLGDIVGPLSARTEAGNITIQRAREGGRMTTGGGTIQLQFSGGPVHLVSGGGDITLRRAVGPVHAETRSGDIAVTFDNGVKTQRMLAKTGKGNIVATLPGRFGADIDAVILTSDATNSIRSDFEGLSIQRDQVGGKTRIRATGKINGGGERIELQAVDGGIHIAIDAPRVSPMVPY